MYRQFNSSLVSSSYQNTLKCAVAALCLVGWVGFVYTQNGLYRLASVSLR